MIREVVLDYLEEFRKVLEGIYVEKIEEMVKIILDAFERESSVFIMGNGGSAATASHFACDINKGTCFDLKKRFKVICLNDNIPTILAYANDYSYEDIFVEQVKNFLRPGDVVIGISASGNSKNVLKAIEYANKNGAQTLGLTGFDGGKLASLAKATLVIKVNDMQKVEDAHLIVTHIIMQIVYKKLHNRLR